MLKRQRNRRLPSIGNFDFNRYTQAKTKCFEPHNDAMSKCQFRGCILGNLVKVFNKFVLNVKVSFGIGLVARRSWSRPHFKTENKKIRQTKNQNKTK